MKEDEEETLTKKEVHIEENETRVTGNATNVITMDTFHMTAPNGRRKTTMKNHIATNGKTRKKNHFSLITLMKMHHYCEDKSRKLKTHHGQV